MIGITDVYAADSILHFRAEDLDSGAIRHRAIDMDSVVVARDPAAVLAYEINAALKEPPMEDSDVD